ncbi:MAG: hypothetical protein COS82_06680 [Zetaproteobacteria bacterium CG06_land_8_20_14_3_00_59_53]|nr:MAG: hypothetical protein COX56_05985 [Zetaproteobacteria bacterium CG23_combo_of_CG06-09_8_20_14_all_59_86]PIQ64403.1 MAG: hypothetical protein COV97_10240 [Zetaproteobacteria bacterium CG11_big_fil_rev_8_21_14_0_20_59_439]PIU70479.1 MAG: hypothetical protein COS82_06680 [Zetaproteobacteria bacterium CG06_land_8_20_14_3_00_59_53]PIU97526.1 MAG: hypothetical protein COS62_03865 [Zetaproteobacteria bacterium CG03_land_8_20_14_0_80_59_51]PIY46674.1 MAG: hypothetical protein COZ02_04760 [Zetapr
MQLQDMTDNSPQVSGVARFAAMANNSSQVAAQRRSAESIHNSPHAIAQRQQIDSLTGEPTQLEEVEEPLQAKSPQGEGAPEKPNNTGLPDNLKNGIESLSGMSMDGVKVHYNSSQPAQLNALAYAQGTDIHVAPGQERHLPHEAWHVVQQAQDRVQPTMQMKDDVPVNDDQSLEHEADVMGGKASMLSLTTASLTTLPRGSAEPVVQGLFGMEVEANIPVYAPQSQWPDAGNEQIGEIVAFLKGTDSSKGTYLHEGKAGDPKPFQITLDSGGPTKECIKELREDWAGKVRSNQGRFPRKSKPKKTEYVTEPYSDRYMNAPDDSQKPGLFDFFRDLKIMQGSIQADLEMARGGRRALADEGA